MRGDVWCIRGLGTWLGATERESRTRRYLNLSSTHRRHQDVVVTIFGHTFADFWVQATGDSH